MKYKRGNEKGGWKKGKEEENRDIPTQNREAVNTHTHTDTHRTHKHTHKQTHRE